MKIDQGRFAATHYEHSLIIDQISDKRQEVLIFVFGRVDSNHDWFLHLQSTYPNAHIVSCSSSETIMGSSIFEGEIGYTAVFFEKTPFRVHQHKLINGSSIFEEGKKLVESLVESDLKCVLIFSEGTRINGSELISGVNAVLDQRVIVTGGMASDGAQFVSTTVGYNEIPEKNQLVAVGLYGESITIGFGSKGGWDAFGPKRLVTKSTANILYELDGKNALQLYKKYLGEIADLLPGSALLYPLALHKETMTDYLVRTVLDVNETDASMVFAGDIPEGSLVQLMKANFDRLVDGAAESAESGLTALGNDHAEFALLVSCIGRKLVLGQRIEEEIEVCSSIFGKNTLLAGFYSHGEFSPLTDEVGCQLHNQSMTITTFREA
jgi:hypothetical protein